MISGEAVRELQRAGARQAEQPWVKALGRAGYVAKATVYALIGGLALRLALGGGFFASAGIRRDPGEATGFDGALAAIARQPSGMALLGAVALGLLAYAGFSAIEGRHRRLGAR